MGDYEFFVSAKFAAPESKMPTFVSHFWAVARDSDGANMEIKTETETIGKGTSKVQVAVPHMVNTVALAKGTFLQVAPWPRLQPRAAKKLRTA